MHLVNTTPSFAQFLFLPMWIFPILPCVVAFPVLGGTFTRVLAFYPQRTLLGQGWAALSCPCWSPASADVLDLDLLLGHTGTFAVLLLAVLCIP